MTQEVVNQILAIAGSVIAGVLLWWLEPILKKPRALIIGVVGISAMAVVMLWLLSPLKKMPDAASTSADAASNPRVVPKHANTPPIVKSPQPRSASLGAPPTQSKYFNDALLRDGSAIAPVAIKGNSVASREVLDALAIPLRQGVFKSPFFNDGVFDRALNGDGNGIARLKLPNEIKTVVLLQVGDSQKTSVPDMQGAIKIKRPIAITVMEAHSGAVIKATRFVAEGVGFDEEFVEKSLKEDLSAKLDAVRRAF